VVCREADILLANSKRLSEDLRTWFESDFERNVSVIYNGVDFDRFRPVEDDIEKKELQKKWGLPSGYKFLICVATPVILKGWIELMDAIKNLGEDFSGWKLIAVTTPRNGADALDINKEAKKRGIGQHVIWLGSIDPIHMPDCYRAIDAFILPSHNEGMSNAVVEALASGLPVVTTDVGGHREFIDSDVNGFLIQPNHTDELIAALEKIIGDEKFRKDIASYAREGALRIGSYSQNAKLLLKLFEVYRSNPVVDK